MAVKYKLISFKLCPFVQRSVIILNKKQVPYEIEYIDLKNKPEWFLKISPSGKVPVLLIGNEALFESAIINEYLDEVNPPSLHPSDPLKKARNRAWIEFASGLFTIFFQQAHAKTEEEFNEKTSALLAGMKKLEEQIVLPFFNGTEFNLIDAAIAPMLGRFQYIKKYIPFDYFEGTPKMKQYAERLEQLPEIRNSVLPEVPLEFIDYMRHTGGYMARWFQ